MKWLRAWIFVIPGRTHFPCHWGRHFWHLFSAEITGFSHTKGSHNLLVSDPVCAKSAKTQNIYESNCSERIWRGTSAWRDISGDQTRLALSLCWVLFLLRYLFSVTTQFHKTSQSYFMLFASIKLNWHLTCFSFLPVCCWRLVTLSVVFLVKTGDLASVL